MMLDDDEWDNGEDHLEQTHNTLQQYFARNIQSNNVTQQSTSTSSSPVVMQKRKLSINELSKEQLASLSKEELIELLTFNSTKKKTQDLKQRSKSPRLRKSRQQKRDDDVKKTKSQPNLEESSGIVRLSVSTKPSDSQSEQPSEQRNTNVMLNPLPPEQEERDTPKSEPESSEDQNKRRRAANLDSLMSSTDNSSENVKKLKIRTQDPVIFDDIVALERSVELYHEKMDTITSTDEGQMTIVPILRSQSLKEKEIRILKNPKTNFVFEDLSASAELPKKIKRRKSSKKLRKQTSSLKRVTSGVTKSKRRKRSSSEYSKSNPPLPLKNVNSNSKSPKRTSTNTQIVTKEENQSSHEKTNVIELPTTANNDTLSTPSFNNNNDSRKNISLPKKDCVVDHSTPSVTNSKKSVTQKKTCFGFIVEEDDETDDSYDVEEEMTEESVIINESKSKKKSKLGTQKSVQHLLEMFGSVEHEKQQIEQERPFELEPFITRGEGSDDPRRYLEIGKVINLSQKMLAVCILFC